MCTHVVEGGGYGNDLKDKAFGPDATCTCGGHIRCTYIHNNNNNNNMPSHYTSITRLEEETRHS